MDLDLPEPGTGAAVAELGGTGEGVRAAAASVR